MGQKVPINFLFRVQYSIVNDFVQRTEVGQEKQSNLNKKCQLRSKKEVRNNAYTICSNIRKANFSVQRKR
jgi:hypothetical protein